MTIPYIFLIDLARPTRTNKLLIKQGDSNSRKLQFVLMYDTKAYDMTDVIAAVVSIKLPDGSTIADMADILTDDDGNQINKLEYVITDVVTENYGTADLVVQLVNQDNSVLETFDFYILIRNEIYELPSGIGEDIASPELSGLRDLISRAEQATAKIEAMSMSTTLPNPFPLRLIIENETYEYNGSSTKQIELDMIGYLSDIKVTTTAIEWPVSEE